MRRRLLAGLLALAVGGLSAPAPAPRPQTAAGLFEPIEIRAVPVTLTVPESAALRLVSAHALRSREPAFGGVSAVEIAPDGGSAIFVGDRGHVFTARLKRRDGRIVGVADGRMTVLRDHRGRPLTDELDRDAEAIAVVGDDIFIAFERNHRIWRYPPGFERADPVPGPPGIARLRGNSGIEALAAAPDGTLYAIPERSGALERPFPVWRRAPGAETWETGRWPRRPPFLVTGADIGPDGLLYVLERDFTLLGGWAMRLSRADLAAWPDLVPQTLVEWRREGIDNMEGVSLWRTPAGETRILLVSDDNFQFLQRTLLIEFALD